MRNFYRSVALNILNTTKTFNTTNRTSRFPTRDYSDTIGIYLWKFTDGIPKALLEIRLIVVRFQHFLFKKPLKDK